MYGVPWWGSAFSGVLIATAGTLAVMLLYQFVLFYATLWTVDVPV